MIHAIICWHGCCLMARQSSHRYEGRSDPGLQEEEQQSSSAYKGMNKRSVGCMVCNMAIAQPCGSCSCRGAHCFDSSQGLAVCVVFNQ